MNDIIFAGKLLQDGNNNFQSSKCFTIISAATQGDIVTEGGITPFSRGDAIIVPPSVKYKISRNAEHACLLLDRTLLPIKKVCIISGEGGEEIKAECARAVKYFNGDMDKKQVILSAAGTLITALVTAYYGGNGFSPVVSSILGDIEKNISNPTYSLELYMRSLPLNYDYMRKMFKKEVGITPHDYLLNARMERARSIILSGITNQYSNYTISQIAEMCGFAEPLYFSRVFKKYFGLSPIDYKTKNKSLS